MTMSKFLKLFTLAAALALTGCAAHWTQVTDVAMEDGNHQLRFNAPKDWMRFNGLTATAQSWRFTRDGFLLQDISLAYDEPQAVIRNMMGRPNLKVELKLADDLTAIEVADAVFAEMRRLDAALTLEMVERSAIKVGGVDGFKLVYRWKNAKGLAFQREMRGALKQGKFLLVSYGSVVKNFWARDYATFDQLANSTKLNG
jgi:hypothetical protein